MKMMSARPVNADDAADPHAALERTVAQLQSALDEACSSEARDREFLAAAAHHLRTPVGSIHAGVEALLHGPCLEEREHLFADLVRQGSRAARLVDSLLRLARLDAGEPLRPGPCDLVQVCSQQVQWVRERALHLELVLDAERPLRALHLDQRAVCEILTQMLDNARRHAAGRITVSVAVGDDVRLLVRDDGPGLSEAVVERAFERFTSLDGLGGAGLGLAIAREIARLHGGDLRYADCAFALRLPAQTAGGTA